LDYAAANGLVIISADSDFGELLALSRGAVRPSVVLLRSADRLTPDQQAGILAANLAAVADELKTGALVSIARGRVRIRSLPILGAE
jgi:predicted nuclease of predicted toxin-antitoxin system